MRYRGQSFELEVRKTAGDLAAEFHRVHRERYGYAQEQSEIEIVSARLRSFGVRREVTAKEKIGAGKTKPHSEVTAHVDGQKDNCCVYNRDESFCGSKD